MTETREFAADELRVRVYRTKSDMGQAAARDIATELRETLDRQASARMIFASAPSQDTMLAALAQAPDIDWSRVTALHMDEYLGLPADAPQRFGSYLVERLFRQVRPGRVELIADGDPAREAARYADLVAQAPVDLVCLGIGENGHIAFNDPDVADFADPVLAKVVALDERSRVQQVNDGCFAAVDDVPTHAITLTIPALTGGRRLFCCVPGPTKAAAVARTLAGPIDTDCPASILRNHAGCTLYLDADSAPSPTQ